MLVLGTCASLWVDVSAAVIAESDFSPFVNSGDSVPWNINSVKQGGTSGNHLSTTLEYEPDGTKYRKTTGTKSFIYSVVNNPSVLSPQYVDVDDPMFVMQCGTGVDGEAYKNKTFFEYCFSGMKPGENFTVTIECYMLNKPETNGPNMHFMLDVLDLTSEDVRSYTVDGAPVSSSQGDVELTSQKKHKVTITTKAKKRDACVIIKYPYYGMVAGYALGITSIKVEGAFDPIVRSSLGLEPCKGEQTILSLDKEYNASTYSWQRKNGDTWEEIGTSKNLMYEMQQDEVFQCIVDGYPSNELELKTGVCCEKTVDGVTQAASRRTLLWETFGHFTGPHTYVDRDGNVTNLPTTWPEYWADVSYDLPGHIFDDGKTKCTECKSGKDPGQVNDGYYAIVIPTPEGYIMPDGNHASWMKGVSHDRTSVVTGEANSAALAINVDFDYDGLVFEAEFPDICTGVTVFYETFFANLSAGTTNYPPIITIRVVDSDGNVLHEKADVEADMFGGWQQVKGEFILSGSGTRSVKLQVLSSNGSGSNNMDYWNNGNDLILDDIKFMVCSPPSLEAYSDINTFAKDSTICSEMDFTIDAPVSTLLENFFGGKHKFLFQYSGDLGQTWTNISGLEDTNELSINTANYTSDKMQFRVVAATPDVLNEFVNDPNKADFDDACRNYSITEPFTITRAGDLDLGATAKTSACVNATVTLNAPSSIDFTEVVAWGWTDEAGSAVVALSDDQDNLSYEIAHKSDEKEVYYFIAQTADGCQGKRKYEVDVKPTVDFTYDKVQECGVTTFTITSKTPSDAAFVWEYNGDPYPGDEFVFDETMLATGEDPTRNKAVLLTGTATGYCDNADNAYQFILEPIPGEPAVTSPSLSFVMEAGSKASAKDAATAEPDHTLEWVEVAESVTQEPASGWSSDEPFVSLDVDSTYYFFVRQVNKFGCPGPAEKVHVTVSSSPLPIVMDTVVCVNDLVKITDLVSPTDPSVYELHWYDDKVTPNGSGSLVEPSVPTDKPGVYEFYVTQQSTVPPFPESKLQTVTVEVVGVYEPDTVGNTYHYCSDDTPVDLVAKLNKDESKSYYADEVVWSVNGGSESKTKPTVDTHVNTTTTYEYKAYQTYTIKNANKEVCKGDPVTWEVEVTFVPALSTSQVTYMKADAENGTFAKNLMEQSENDAITDYASTMKLWWYEDDCTTKVGNGKTAPTPKVDPSVAAGVDQELSYCVRQEVDGCLSEGTEVPVLISDAPKPNPTDYVYCKGDAADKLTTKPDMTIKPNATYVLKWYGNGDRGNYTDLHITGDDGPTPTTNMRAGDIGKSEYYYYVTQTEIVNGQEGAESNRTEIKVTVYDQTEISIDKGVLGAVCKPATVDISKSVSFTNEVANLNYDTRYYADNTLADELTSTKVGVSGDYYVQTSFEVKSKSNKATCVSDPTPIPVTVDTLQVLVEDVGTCPNMEAKFTVQANTNTTGVKYIWNAVDGNDPNGGTSTNAEFTTRKFTGADYGDVFEYTLKVEAGTCTYDDKLKVTLGEGPVTGTMTITEDGNSYEPNTFTDTKFNEFYSCGAPLKIKADYHEADGTAITDYKWYDGTKQIGTGAELELPETANSGDRTYRVDFTNGCPTNVTITIHYRPIKATPLSTKITKLCEGKEFSAEVKTEFAEGESPVYTWYRNGAEVEMGGGTSLDVSRTKLTIDKVKTTDSGRYTFLMTNRGCEARAELDSLVAMPYIVATEKIDTIVARYSNPNIALDVTVPAGGADVKYDWKGTRGESESTNPLSLSNVTSDHYYEVTLSAEDHCDATAIVDVKVDAKLVLKTTLKDTICTGLSAVLTIDTTGTGKFRHEDWNRSLTVSVTSEGVTSDLTGSVTRDGDLLKLTVSPTTTATYKINFNYGPQDTTATELLYVIPAIGVTIPEAVTICQGEATDIVITDIQPEGTVIQWNADTTILTESLDTAAVTVKPVYLGGTNHQYQYAYDFVAYNTFCNSSVPYTAYVKVDEPLEGEILGTKVICETFSSRLDASSYAATTYVWTVEGDTVNQGASMTVTPAKTTHYFLSMDRGVCHKDDNFLLTVKTNPVIVDMDSVDIRNREVILKDGAGEEPFNFWVDDLEESKTIDPVLYNLKFSKHTAHVSDKNGCVGEFLFEVPAPGIYIPPYFTPNSDGINDNWIVAELPIVYPNAVVKIYDRFGKLIAEYLGSKEEGWDGTYKGQPMPSTDYWYVIDVEEIDRQFLGHFTLIRQ